MGAFSSFTEDGILDHLLRNSALSSPTSVYLALFTDAGAGLEANNPSGEVTGGGYARLNVGGATGRSFTDPDGTSQSSNNEAWEFPEATEAWGEIHYVAIMDASTNGNVLFWRELDASMKREILTGDIYYIKAGNLTVTLD